MSGDFDPDLGWSHEIAGMPFWIEVYRRAFPGFVAAHTTQGDGWHQRAGRDRIVVLDDSSTITIDEKGRRDEWPDILIEVLSDRDREVPGWGHPKKRLSCDYIGYAFIPSQTCHLIPYRELRRIMGECGPGREWWREAARNQRDGIRSGIQLVDARNPRDTSRPVKYWTRSIAVPVGTLLAAVASSLTIGWREPAPEPAALAEAVEQLPEDGDWPEVAKIPGAASCPGSASTTSSRFTARSRV